jgi:hypothetical protein
MKKIIFAIFICSFNLPASAIDYNDFPPNLQQILNERIAELKSNGGICIAGSVIMSDETNIGSGKDVKVNFLKNVDKPIDIYDGGWFIMDRTLKSDSYAGLGKLVLRAFGYDPIDASIAVLKGQITYVEYVMQKTPAEKLTAITGKVVNDQNEPMVGIRVNLDFPYAYSVANEHPMISKITESNGRYLFENLSETEYNLYIAATSGYAGVSANTAPAKGKTAIKDIKLYKNLSIIIDYVYQAEPNNSSFTEGDLQTGTLEWVNGHEGVDFSDGRVEGYDSQSLRDIEMRQDQGWLNFQIFYVNGQNGFYDAGAVDFESVTEAAQTGYSTDGKPCVIGHTYVVRTYESNYAKFVVISISGSK